MCNFLKKMFHCYLCTKSWDSSSEPLYLLHMMHTHSFCVEPKQLIVSLSLLLQNRVSVADANYDTVLNQFIGCIYEAGLPYSLFAKQPQYIYDFVTNFMRLYYPQAPCPIRVSP
jgi:hypothetical protein